MVLHYGAIVQGILKRNFGFNGKQKVAQIRKKLSHVKKAFRLECLS